MPQWPRLAASRQGGSARSGLALVTAQAVSSHFKSPVFASCTTLSIRTMAATWGNSTTPEGVGATRIVRVSIRPWPLFDSLYDSRYLSSGVQTSSLYKLGWFSFTNNKKSACFLGDEELCMCVLCVLCV